MDAKTARDLDRYLTASPPEYDDADSSLDVEGQGPPPKKVGGPPLRRTQTAEVNQFEEKARREKAQALANKIIEHRHGVPLGRLAEAVSRLTPAEWAHAAAVAQVNKPGDDGKTAAAVFEIVHQFEVEEIDNVVRTRDEKIAHLEQILRDLEAVGYNDCCEFCARRKGVVGWEWSQPAGEVQP